jgi:uncharacterized protein
MGRLHVRIRPGARRTAFAGWFGDLPRMTVAAPPVGGAANEELVRAVARIFDIKPRHVHIVGGAASRSKRLELDGVDDDEISAVLQRLNPR